MSKKLGRDGFTLVELLAVLVIMAAIMGIAIPSLTSSMERSKKKQLEDKLRMLESFAEFYVTDHRNAIYRELNGNTVCYIKLETLKDEGYLSNGALEDADGNAITGFIVFDSKKNAYIYNQTITAATDGDECLP